MIIDSAHVSDKGPCRRRNEDFSLAYPARGLFLVADGLGGAIAGDRASRVASETAAAMLTGSARIEELIPDTTTIDAVRLMAAQHEDPSLPRAQIRLAILVAHCRVLAEARDTGCVGMATAIIVAWLTDQRWWIGHVGDCRAYGLAAGRLTLLTRDHSLSAALAGRSTLPRSLENSPFLQSRLTQVVGGEHVPTPDVRDWDATRGTRLLICSDGVWNALSDGELHASTALDAPAEEICRALVTGAIRAGSRDNATALVVKI